MVIGRFGLSRQGRRVASAACVNPGCLDRLAFGQGVGRRRGQSQRCTSVWMRWLNAKTNLSLPKCVTGTSLHGRVTPDEQALSGRAGVQRTACGKWDRESGRDQRMTGRAPQPGPEAGFSW